MFFFSPFYILFYLFSEKDWKTCNNGWTGSTSVCYFFFLDVTGVGGMVKCDIKGREKGRGSKIFL